MSSTIRSGDQSPAMTGWGWLPMLLAPLPPLLLGITLGSDALYWVTAWPLWASASEWVLGAALAGEIAAAANTLLGYAGAGAIRPSRACRIQVFGNLAALLLSAASLVCRLNADAGHAVALAGVALTAVALCVLIVMAHPPQRAAETVRIDDEDLF